jgi:AraC-like DNA-binding protein
MLGLVGFIALASPSAGAALQNFIELFPCHQNGTETRIAFAGDLVRMEYRILDREIVERRQDAEFTMGIFTNLVRRCLGGQLALVQVDFEHPAPQSSAAHYQAFDSEIAFSQRTNALVLRTSGLDTPMPNGNLALLDLLRSSLTALACPEIASDLVTRARAEIRGSLANGTVTLGRVADVLGVSRWSLQRRLGDDGLTFSGLVEEVRQELTTVYIRQNHIPLSEIAFLLGYSEPSAFSRAFRQWHGISPQAFRRGKFGTNVPAPERSPHYPTG